MKSTLFYSISLLLILALTACHNNPENQDETGNRPLEDQVKEYYRRMEGATGDQKAVLQLVKYQSQVLDIEGATSDRYRGILLNGINGAPLDVSGYKEMDSIIQLITYDHYSPVDTFRGVFTNGSFKGTVTDTTGKHQSFTFKESYPAGSYHWAVTTYSDSLLFDSADADGPKAETNLMTLWPGSDIGSAQKALLADTLSQGWFGATKTFSKPQALLQAVSDSFIQKYRQSAEDWKKDGDGTTGPSFNWNALAHTDLIYNADDMISLRYTQYQFTGGAHGLQSVFCTVVDMKNARVLGLADVFKQGFEQKLQQVLEQELREQYNIPEGQPLNGEQGLLFDPHLPVSHNFYLTGKGIGFIYNPYEVAPYAVGEINLYLPFSRITDLLRK